jgi:hypothetical protein
MRSAAPSLRTRPDLPIPTAQHTHTHTHMYKQLY